MPWGHPHSEEALCLLSLQSLLVTHTVPVLSLARRVGSDRATPRAQRRSLVSSPQGSQSHGVRGLVQKGQMCAPLERGGLRCLVKG